ncbi:MAG: methyltransferase domain-containing protein [Candidatus Cloacimonetes bacterium]|nr:methyltransferase domain-containing protein [Candidatus Cloacimonadota bacterium]
MPKTKPFDENYEQYEEWFENNKYAYLSELKAVKHFIPEDKKGIDPVGITSNGVEIGIGSGKFAVPLGIKVGVEPSKVMAKLARERGLKVYIGVGEKLPFENSSFDFALMVTTICFLDDVEKSFSEVKRILKPGGSFIIGFVDKHSPLGKQYLRYKNENVFYKIANFFSTKQVLEILKNTGFKDFEVVQTVFGEMSYINKIQNFKESYGEGGFVVIKSKI